MAKHTKQAAEDTASAAVNNPPADPSAFVVAQNLRRLLHLRKCDDQDLAKFLDVTSGALSRAFRRPNGFEKGRQIHLHEVARFVQLDETQLKDPGLIERLDRGDLPRAFAMPSERGPGKPVMEYVFGEKAKESAEELRLPPSCRLLKLPVGERGHQWVLCAPDNRRPREGDPAVVRTKSGRTYFRTWRTDAEDPTLVVLISGDPAEKPVSLRLEQIEDAWLVIMPMGTGA